MKLEPLAPEPPHAHRRQNLPDLVGCFGGKFSGRDSGIEREPPHAHRRENLGIWWGDSGVNFEGSFRSRRHHRRRDLFDVVLCHRMYLLISFRKSTPPQHRQPTVYYYLSKY